MILISCFSPDEELNKVRKFVLTQGVVCSFVQHGRGNTHTVSELQNVTGLFSVAGYDCGSWAGLRFQRKDWGRSSTPGSNQLGNNHFVLVRVRQYRHSERSWIPEMTCCYSKIDHELGDIYVWAYTSIRRTKTCFISLWLLQFNLLWSLLPN